MNNIFKNTIKIISNLLKNNKTKKCKNGKQINPKTGRCVSIVKFKDEQDDDSFQMIIHPPTKEKMSCINNSKMNLKQYQQNISRFLDTNRGIIVVHGIGSGKTLSAVTASQCFLKKNPESIVIVSTPKSLIHNFKKEMENYGIDKIDPHYVFYTHDELCNLIKNEKVALSYFHKNMLIIDEIHNFRTQPLIKEDKDGNIKYSQAYYAIKAAHASEKVIGLTATPIVNSMTDLKNLLSMISGKKISQISETPSYENLEKYKSLFSFYQRNTNDPEYPSKYIHYENVKMSLSYYKQFNKLQEVLHSQNKEYIKTFHLSLRMAVNKLDNDKESPKVLWTIQLIKNGLKTLVYSGFKDSGVLYIAEHLNKLKIPFDIITGDSSIEERKQIVDDYNENKIKVLLITMAGSEGLDLKETRQVILFEPVWNPSTEEQIIGRAVRRNSHASLPLKERRVDVYKLLMVTPFGQKTVDHTLTNIINNKINMIEDANKIIKKLSIELNQSF
jgi:SNF2 family DNA or RNA helicase